MNDSLMLHEKFHEFPNRLNKISMAAFTFADHIKRMDADKITPAIKNDISERLAAIYNYWKLGCETLKTTFSMLNRIGIGKDAKNQVNAVNDKMTDIETMIKELNIMYDKIDDSNLQKDALNIADKFNDVSLECSSCASLFSALRKKLIEDKKY